ncbi:hypothetical protein FVE85_8916 [Porphyridium purpureum]|uniref:Uncharacterized protein n=1 Tax=Porphyridium purpureum TaxID=35688 RepID=A0A5J4YH76_PORPP|nr:hypothetical protein FVE85_8916 [Porphyridium purpureum]|eukprot:POR0654..scf276_29
MQEVPNGGAGFHVSNCCAVDTVVVSHCEHIVTYIGMESEEILFGPRDPFGKMQLPEQAGSELELGLVLKLNLEELLFLVNVHLEPFKEGCKHATRTAVTDDLAAGTQGSGFDSRGYEHAET